MLAWRFYSDGDGAALFAAAVPALNAARIYASVRSAEAAAGAGEEADARSFLNTMSRTGDPREALGGPLLYTAVLLGCTAAGFRTPWAVVALAQMAVGDGLADLVGRRWGGRKWFCRADKSYVGSAAFVAGAAAASYGLLYWLGLADAGDADLAAKLVAISAACAAVEVAPWLEWADDNLTVPLAGAVLAYALL